MRPAERDVEGNDQRVERDHLHRDDQDDECPASVEPEFREGQCGEEGKRQREYDHDTDDDQAVADVLPEVLPMNRIAEVRQGCRNGKPFR